MARTEELRAYAADRAGLASLRHEPVHASRPGLWPRDDVGAGRGGLSHLHTLHLPIDQLDPWLDARLTLDERRALDAIVAKRIATRKPAPYLTNEAWVQGHAFYVDERVIVPRSYIGELMSGGLEGVVADLDSVERVLDLCTGSGCLAMLAALRFPEATVDASDVSADALAVAERNVATYGLGERIALVRSDLFAGLAGRTYDLILSNPPYVSAEAVAAFPPEYAAEPVLAHAGGEDGLDLVRRILAEAGRHLTADGALVVEIGTAATSWRLNFRVCRSCGWIRRTAKARCSP